MSIPQQVRQQFQCDANGRVLFFTAPPLDTLPPYKEGGAQGHSIRYLAAKEKREALLAEKRRREEAERPAVEEARKKARLQEAAKQQVAVQRETVKALGMLEEQLVQSTRKTYKQLAPDEWERVMELDFDTLEKAQREAREMEMRAEEHERMRMAEWHIPIRGLDASLEYR